MTKAETDSDQEPIPGQMVKVELVSGNVCASKHLTGICFLVGNMAQIGTICLCEKMEVVGFHIYRDKVVAELEKV